MDRLLPGQALYPGDSLTSANGQYTLIMQHDGNLVIYTNGRPIWDSKTTGRAVSRAIMQDDGNFVIYGYPGALWATGTTGYKDAYLIMQNDGNLVIYGHKAAWATNTNRYPHSYPYTF